MTAAVVDAGVGTVWDDAHVGRACLSFLKGYSLLGLNLDLASMEPDEVWANACLHGAAGTADVDPGRVVEAAETAGVRFVIPGDPEWPMALNALGLESRPVGLWVLGRSLVELPELVAVTGGRAASELVAPFVSGVVERVSVGGRGVVSSMALGTAEAAVRAALAAGAPVVAFMPGGLDVMWPSAARELRDRVAASGAVVSERPLGFAPMGHADYARCEQLEAALAGSVVVCEPRRRTAALGAVQAGVALGRAVFVLPSAAGSRPDEVLDAVAAGAVVPVESPDEVIAGEQVRELVESLLGDSRWLERSTVIVQMGVGDNFQRSMYGYSDLMGWSDDDFEYELGLQRQFATNRERVGRLDGTRQVTVVRLGEQSPEVRERTDRLVEVLGREFRIRHDVLSTASGSVCLCGCRGASGLGQRARGWWA